MLYIFLEFFVLSKKTHYLCSTKKQINICASARKNTKALT